MLRRFASVVPAATIAAVIAFALAGCSAGAIKPVDSHAGEPEGVDAPASSAGGAAYAVWLRAGEQFGITLYGSSTCPPKVALIRVEKTNQIAATLGPAPGGLCARDYAPYTTVFPTPDGVTTTSEINIILPDATLTLPSLPG